MRASYPLPIVNDDNIEDTETFAALLSTSESNMNIGDGNATITVLDDDSELFYCSMQGGILVWGAQLAFDYCLHKICGNAS